MSFYANAFNTAKSLLTTYGQTVTLTGESSGSGYDPATGEPITPTVETVLGVGAVFPYGSMASLSAQNATESAILAGDVKLTLSTTGEPKVGMTTTLNGSVWRVIAVDQIAPAGSAVYYDIQLRK
jgi:hypothetical protein